VFTPGLLHQESVSGSSGSKRAATASERRVDRAPLGRMRRAATVHLRGRALGPQPLQALLAG
jgi:hypothetical protein